MDGAFAGGPYFAWDWNMVLYVGLTIQVVYSVFGQLINSSPLARGQDRATKMSQQDMFLLSTHMVFAVLFTVQVFPYTYVALNFFFTPLGLHDFMIPWTNSIMEFSLNSRVLLYTLEGAVRAVIKPNVFISLHHCLYFVFVITGVVTRSVFALKVMICLDLFAAWEFALFACLVARKLRMPDMVVRALLIIGIIFYGLTRILQAVILGSLFAYGYAPLSHTSRNRGIYWGFFIMCILFAALQLYTFVIYKSIWHSINKAAYQRRHIRVASKDQAAVVAGNGSSAWAESENRVAQSKQEFVSESAVAEHEV